MRDLPTAPGPVRRPPIIVGGQAPTMLRVAVSHGDVWNTNGQFGASVAEIATRTREQNDRLDAMCLEAGRDPATLRRQFLLWDTTDPLVPEGSLPDLVAQLTEAGIEDFVLCWPWEPSQMTKFEHLAQDVIPNLREA